MERLRIIGMSCAACSARVERALKSTPGVVDATVNLLANSANVEGTASVDELIASVRRAGYDAAFEKGSESGADSKSLSPLAEDESSEMNRMIKRLIFSALLTSALVYLSTGVGMFRFPAPGYLVTPGAFGLAQLLLATAVVLINWSLFHDGLASLRRLSPNMNALVALGAGASYIYSVAALFVIEIALGRGDLSAAENVARELYFESTAVILVFISLGKTLETYSKGKTTSALRALAELAPEEATVLRDGQEMTIKLEEMKSDDVFLVRPGDRIPADGTVLDGGGAVDESALTGESLPVDKTNGSEVVAGTLNLSGFLRCQATRVGQDTFLTQIIRLTADAAASKAPVARLADRISAVFVPVVIGIAALAFATWLVVGQTFEFALLRGVSVLLISCPCALGLATPAAIVVGGGLGARKGILFKTAEALENVGKSKIVVLDKTGVLTEGKPKATDALVADGFQEDTLISIAAALEAKSEHPLAKAVMEYAHVRNIDSGKYVVDKFQALPGSGVKGLIHGKVALAGKLDFIQQSVEVSQELREAAEAWGEEGKTSLFFAFDGKLLGAIAVADAPKETSRAAVADLQSLKLRVVMLTGDARRVAVAVGKRVGIDEIYSDVLPTGKEAKVRELRAQGRVAFVGDGINDAPALSRADVGLAVGAGTNVAIDAADVVLVNNDLQDLCRAIRLSRATLTNIKENLFWAFIYNIAGIPLAAGVFIPILGWTLSPVFGAFAMSLSSVCVVTNALRLNFAKIDAQGRGDSTREKISNVSQDEKIHSTKETDMKKTLKIEGMMCGHCEARVKKTLESLEYVSSVAVSHVDGEAVVELKETSDDVVTQLKKAVEAEGYSVQSVE